MVYILFSIILSILIGLNFVFYMHMFQLGGYHGNVQLKWYLSNIKTVFLRQGGGVISPFAIGILTFSGFGRNTALIFGGSFLFFSLLFSFPKKAKKRLVFTHRVMRMIVTSLLIYGILIGVLFFCFRGNLFLLPLLHWITPFSLILANYLNVPVEKFIGNRYIREAKSIIDSHKNLTVIGITGSYGKTSVKFYLGSLLSSKFNVLITPESYNTTMGVVKTVRENLSGAHEIFVCEMGAKKLGEIKEICDIVKPKHSLITSIGEQHLESFKTIDNIISTKFEIAEAVNDGIVFLNYNNQYIKNHPINKNTISYGIENGKDYYATNIKVSAKGTSFTLNAPDGVTAKFETALIGAHNVENIVGAIAVANFMGISFSELYLPVKRLECVPHRMQLHGGGNRIVIDDSFNSNPSGAKAALNVLSSFEGTRFLVTPGMIELGDREYQLNRELGENAADCCDYAILVGEKQAVPIREGLIGKGFPADSIYVAKSLSEAMTFVDNLSVSGKKIILLENDLPDNY